jgi:hypothetical protein
MSSESGSRCFALGVLSFSAACAAFQIDANAAALGGSQVDVQLAYIDPGAGSLVIQALVGAAAAILVTGRLYWKRIKGWFGGASEELEDDGDLSSSRERSRPTDD